MRRNRQMTDGDDEDDVDDDNIDDDDEDDNEDDVNNDVDEDDGCITSTKVERRKISLQKWSEKKEAGRLVVEVMA